MTRNTNQFNSSFQEDTSLRESVVNMTVEQCANVCVGIPLEEDLPDGCYPMSYTASLIAGVVCIIVTILGASGNLLTLLALPYARFRGCEHIWNPTTLFVLNLSAADLLYCMVNLPLFTSTYLHQRWMYSATLCELAAFFRYINAFGDWMSLAFIAVNRCILLTKPTLGEKLFNIPNGFIFIFFIWLYSVSVLLPVWFSVWGKFGYNKLFGKCDFIQVGNVDPHSLMFGLNCAIPCAIIITSYAIIYFKVRNSSRTIGTLGSAERTRLQLQQRDIRLTWTILFLFLVYLVCILPISLVHIIDEEGHAPELQLFLFCIYFLQYCGNVVIYSMQNEQYRKAYVRFLSDMWNSLSAGRSRCCTGTIYKVFCFRCCQGNPFHRSSSLKCSPGQSSFLYLRNGQTDSEPDIFVLPNGPIHNESTIYSAPLSSELDIYNISNVRSASQSNTYSKQMISTTSQSDTQSYCNGLTTGDPLLVSNVNSGQEKLK